ncbi:MAG: PKD domain-containing protein [Solirubrobacteraceae bacterium]
MIELGVFLAGTASGTGPQSSRTGQVPVGRYVLDLDDPGGYSLTPASSGSDSRAIGRAIAKTKRQRRQTHGAIERVDDAAEVTSKIERGITLYRELTSGVLDLESASDEIDGLVSLLRRLDREGRWEEELLVAHCLSVLLALIGRWLELLRSLRTALHAAEQFGDPSEHAWVLHELGTVHLLAGRHADADRLLGKARQIREDCGDRRGLRVTDGNLGALCKTLRQSLPDGPVKQLARWLAHNPAIAVLIAAALLAGGGTAGAVIAHSNGPHPHPVFHLASGVGFSFAPASPRAGQSIAFSATATDPQDPVVSYTWSWGDGDPTKAKVQRHVYAKVGKYRVLLTVKDAGGRVTGHVAHSVVVQLPPEPGPNADFSLSPRSPAVGSTVSFDARSSFDPGTPIVSYVWQFGDTHVARGVTTSHVYNEAGKHLVSLSITDARGRRARLAEVVAVTSAGPVRRTSEIRLDCAPSTVQPGEAVTVSGHTQPQRPDAAVTVTLSSSAHPTLTEPSTTNSVGAFTVSATPEAGPWSAQAAMQGTSTYLPSTSEACTFSVAARGGGEAARKAKEHEEQLAREKAAAEDRAAEARLRERTAQVRRRNEEREREEAKEKEQEERVAAEEAKRLAAPR